MKKAEKHFSTINLKEWLKDIIGHEQLFILVQGDETYDRLDFYDNKH